MVAAGQIWCWINPSMARCGGRRSCLSRGSLGSRRARADPASGSRCGPCRQVGEGVEARELRNRAWQPSTGAQEDETRGNGSGACGVQEVRERRFVNLVIKNSAESHLKPQMNQPGRRRLSHRC